MSKRGYRHSLVSRIAPLEMREAMKHLLLGMLITTASSLLLQTSGLGCRSRLSSIHDGIAIPSMINTFKQLPICTYSLHVVKHDALSSNTLAVPWNLGE